MDNIYRILAVATIVGLIVGCSSITNLNRTADSEVEGQGVENDPNTVRIEVNSHQWAWDARYSGPDGEWNTADDIVTLNDIRIPIDTPILVHLASADVIHSFNLPNLRVKQDAVPGNITPIWFQAVETGQFDIACAEHCGAAHYKMRGTLTVLSKEDYAEWAAEASERSALAYNPDDADAHWGWPWKEI